MGGRGEQRERQTNIHEQTEKELERKNKRTQDRQRERMKKILGETGKEKQ